MARGSAIRADIDYRKIERKLDAAVDRGQKVLDLQVLKDCEPYVPRDEGELVRSGIRATNPGDGEVVWDAPYANRQYYGFPNKARDVNPLASRYWFERAKAARETVWKRIAKAKVGDWR
jgi:hypothetical protein